MTMSDGYKVRGHWAHSSKGTKYWVHGHTAHRHHHKESRLHQEHMHQRARQEHLDDRTRIANLERRVGQPPGGGNILYAGQSGFDALVRELGCIAHWKLDEDGTVTSTFADTSGYDPNFNLDLLYSVAGTPTPPLFREPGPPRRGTGTTPGILFQNDQDHDSANQARLSVDGSVFGSPISRANRLTMPFGNESASAALRTISGWFVANTSSYARYGILQGTTEFDSGGLGGFGNMGWGVIYDHNFETLKFVVGLPTAVLLVTPFAANAGYYHYAVTLDGSVHGGSGWTGGTFTLYINGVAVDSAANPYGNLQYQAASHYHIGNAPTGIDFNHPNGQFYGAVYDNVLFSDALTPAQVSELFRAQITDNDASWTPVTIGAGDDSGADQPISSGTATSGDVLTSNGDGTTKWTTPGSGGTTWYVGSAAPSTLHTDGDFYLRTSNGEVYKQVSGAWVDQSFSLEGPTGVAGADGTTWYSGSAAPSTLHTNGDYYLRTSNGEVYKQVAGAWVDQSFSLLGPAGAAGSAWYSGSAVPSTLHNNGDFYVRTTNGEIYEQVAGAWVDQGFSILGPTGPTGSTGATGAGNAWYTGSAAPTSLHNDGDFYLRSSNGEIYEQVAGAWVDQGFSILGATPLRDLECVWQIPTPPTGVGQAGGIWTIPYDDGVSKTFNLTRAKLRFETPPTVGTYTLDIEKSSPGGAFVGSIVKTLTVTVGGYEDVETSIAATLTSGDLVRVNFTGVGTGALVATITLEGQATS